MDLKQIEERAKKYERTLELSKNRQAKFRKNKESQGKKLFKVWLDKDLIWDIERKKEKSNLTWEEFFERIVKLLKTS